MNIQFSLIAASIILMALALFFILRPALRQERPRRPKRHQGMRRTWRKLYLMPLGLRRLAGWLPGRNIEPEVQFANIGEGSYEKGLRSYIPDAAAGSRYLLYTRGSDADHCAVAGAGADPLGPSDDQAGSDGVPIAINVLGAGVGTIRVTADGTLADGNYVKCGANGYATKASTGDLSFGRALISTDTSANNGDVITIIPMAPAKYAF